MVSAGRQGRRLERLGSTNGGPQMRGERATFESNLSPAGTETFAQLTNLLREETACTDLSSGDSKAVLLVHRASWEGGRSTIPTRRDTHHPGAHAPTRGDPGTVRDNAPR